MIKMVMPTVDHIYMECSHCGYSGNISWDTVRHSIADFDDTYGEFECPVCKNKMAVYTREKIADIQQKKVKDI